MRSSTPFALGQVAEERALAVRMFMQQLACLLTPCRSTSDGDDPPRIIVVRYHNTGAPNRSRIFRSHDGNGRSPVMRAFISYSSGPACPRRKSLPVASNKRALVWHADLQPLPDTLRLPTDPLARVSVRQEANWEGCLVTVAAIRDHKDLHLRRTPRLIIGKLAQV
jgi:hypothetical protein